MATNVARTAPRANLFLARLERPGVCEAMAAALALAIRLWFIAGFAHSPLFDGTTGAHDRALYHREAQRVASGRVWPDGAFAYLPLYPWLLGGAYAIAGPRPGAAAALGIAADALTAALLVRLARRLGARPLLALGGAAVFAAYPPAITYAGLTMPVSLNTLLATVTALALAAPPTLRQRLVAGLIGGLTALGFPAVLPGLLALAVLDAWRRRWTQAALLLFGVALPILPIALHNSRAEGRPVLLSTHGGFNVYMGNHPRATGYPVQVETFRMTAGHLLEDAHRAAEQAVGRPLTRSESSAWWSARARAFWREHPAKAAGLLLRKVALFWNRAEVDDLRMVELQRLVDRRFGSILWPGAALFVALGLFGALHRSTPAALRLLLIAASLSTAAAFITARYRLPLYPAMTACGLAALAAVRRGHADRRALLASVALALGTIALVALPFPVRDLRAVDAANATQHLIPAGRIDDADRLVADALALEPANPDLLEALGTIRFRQTRYADAADAFARALALRPDRATPRFNLVLSLGRAGRACDAIAAAGPGPFAEPRLSSLVETLRPLCAESTD